MPVPSVIAELPPTCRVRPDPAYTLARTRQHLGDRYAGLALNKFPEDLRAYEHLLWLDAPDTVIELGAWQGGSALWFRDRLRTLHAYGLIARPLVVSIDLDAETPRRNVARIDPDYRGTLAFLAGDVRDPTTADEVRRLVGPDRRCFVVEDSAHDYVTTRAALEHFSEFVPPGGFFVVEDTCVDDDERRLEAYWPRGVTAALRDWLATPQGAWFEVRPDLELYGLTCHPGGFLQRVR